MDSDITGTKKRFNGDIMRPSEQAASLTVNDMSFFVKITLNAGITAIAS